MPNATRRTFTVTADGARLRALRRERGISQEALASQAGISPATVARLESRPHPTCRGRTLARLAGPLGAETAAALLATPSRHP